MGNKVAKEIDRRDARLDYEAAMSMSPESIAAMERTRARVIQRQAQNAGAEIDKLVANRIAQNEAKKLLGYHSEMDEIIANRLAQNEAKKILGSMAANATDEELQQLKELINSSSDYWKIPDNPERLRARQQIINTWREEKQRQIMLSSIKPNNNEMAHDDFTSEKLENLRTDSLIKNDVQEIKVKSIRPCSTIKYYHLLQILRDGPEEQLGTHKNWTYHVFYFNGRYTANIISFPNNLPFDIIGTAFHDSIDLRGRPPAMVELINMIREDRKSRLYLYPDSGQITNENGYFWTKEYFLSKLMEYIDRAIAIYGICYDIRYNQRSHFVGTPTMDLINSGRILWIDPEHQMQYSNQNIAIGVRDFERWERQRQMQIELEYIQQRQMQQPSAPPASIVLPTFKLSEFHKNQMKKGVKPDDECSFCNEELLPTCVVRDCGHIHCAACVAKWPVCPPPCTN